MFFVRDFCSEKCVIKWQEIFEKVEGQLHQKHEIKNRFRFEIIDQKVKPKSQKLLVKKIKFVDQKMDNTLHQLFIKKLI